MRWFWLLLGLLAGPLRGTGQGVPFEFSHIQEAQGLSHKLVNCLFRDRDGFLWVGTYGGLNRFDGSRFTVFKHHPRLPQSVGSNVIHAIGQDPKGDLWLATENGISRLDLRTGRFHNIPSVNGLLLKSCTSLCCDRQGRLWFSSADQGLFLYDPAQNRFRHFTHQPANPASLTHNYIVKKGLLEDPTRHGLWVATDQGLNFLDFATYRFRNYRSDTLHRRLFSPHYVTAPFLAGNRLYFADNTAGQIVQYDLKRHSVYCTLTPQSRTRRPVFPITSLFVDQRHNLWISSWSNLLFWNRAGSSQADEFAHDPARKTSVAANFFWAAWQQEDGTIWLGTVNGLSYTNPNRTFYRIHDLGRLHPTLNDNRGLNSFLEDDDGSWWLSTAANELLRYVPASGALTVFPIPASAPAEGGFGRPELDFSPDKETIYVLTSQSLLLFRKRSRQFLPFPEAKRLKQRMGKLSVLLTAGDSLWLFGREKNLAVSYRPATGAWHEFLIPAAPGRQDRFFVRQAAFDRRGQLWLDVYPGGFAYFSKPARAFVDVPPGEAVGYEDHFFFFKVDSLNQFWLPASGHGLVRYNPQSNTYQLWTEFDGLLSGECKAVCTDAEGRIWVAAKNKFSVLDPYRRISKGGSIMNRLGVPSPAENHIHNFTLALNEAEANYENYMFPLRNGHILATLKSYVVEFMPQRFNARSTSTQVLISRLDLPDTTRLVQAGQPTVELGVHDNNFSISYSVLNQPREAFSYSYKLEGYDENWVSAGSRTVANYTKIPGGRYVFVVRATSGATLVKPARLTILVDTPFYATRWFRLGVLLLLAGLAYGLYRYRTRETARMHHLQMQATRLERDKTDIQYKNLINHLNPHFLFNSLASLNSLIRTEPRQASVFLQKLSSIYRYILQSRDKETVSLEHELAFVRHYTDLQKSRFEDALHVAIDIPPACLQRGIVPVTLQNLFENAIKHNVLEDESPLVIRVFVDDDYLVVRNNLQRKLFVETSNQQGLESLQTLYRYLSDRPLTAGAAGDCFVVRIPLL